MEFNRSRTVGGVVRRTDTPLPETTPKVEEKIWPRPKVMPRVGQVVLFNVGNDVDRPLLVVDADADGRVSGLVFLHPEKDRVATWVRKYAFSQPTNSTPFNLVLNARWGEEEGQWYAMPEKRQEVTVPHNPLLLSTGIPMGDARMTDAD